RKVHKPLNHFWNYQLYILLFPKLIAGPIIRYHEISDQLTQRPMNATQEMRLAGIYRFALGLAKKVLIANAMAAQADIIFKLPVAEMSTSTAWIGAFAYTFQIYFDFSGYSDMAIGIGKMLGFRFPENFNNPYISQSITEFWRRWHITLGSWMRNYLYIPLGGNRVASPIRLYLNLWLVFLFSGLWHGASWNFVIWGAYHGLFLVWERGYGLQLLQKIGKFPSILLSFLVVVVGWVFFRIETFTQASQFAAKMFSFHFHNPLLKIDISFYFFLGLAIFFSFFAIVPSGQRFQEKIYTANLSAVGHGLMTIVTMLLLFISLSSITSSNFNPFIYFRF
ncbi:MAG: MBOAT family O-acyltransferase, partial [Bacteroidia bacterium]